MNQNLRPLDTADRETTFVSPNSWSFAASQTLVPIALIEAEALAAEYALVFSKEADGSTAPIALLGTGTRNVYVNDQGEWQAHAIPAALRLYPFSLAKGADPEQFVVMRDADAPHFQGEEGQPLFDDQGTPSALVQQAISVLVEVHRSQLEAQALAQQLKEKGVIGERRIDVQLKDGSWRSYAGFLAIDEDALNNLDEPSRESLDQSGALQLLALHQNSLNNFARLI